MLKEIKNTSGYKWNMTELCFKLKAGNTFGFDKLYNDVMNI